MKLIMLGTGNAAVTKCYNTCFAMEREDGYFLVDGGGGNQILRNLEAADIPINKIKYLFLTHNHSDHIFGVIWIIRMIATEIRKGRYQGNFNIYCHDEGAQAILTICRLTLVKKFVDLIGERIIINVVEDGQKIGNTTFFDIHSGKMKQFGFTMEYEEGKTLTCLGDEPFNEANEEMVKGSTWLLCEAFCLFEERDKFKPYEKHHSTAQDAGILAENLNIENIVLYHTEDRNLKNRKERYTKEAKMNFSGNVVIPDDLEVIQL